LQTTWWRLRPNIYCHYEIEVAKPHLNPLANVFLFAVQGILVPKFATFRYQIKYNPMETTLNRSRFIKTTLASAATLFLPPSLMNAQQQEPQKPPQIKLEIVKEFVGVSHGKFDRMKEMIDNDHLLLHVSYDWGGGDYESGIEAAGHVGNKEIATYLLNKGARYNIYLASMLGHLDIVKQVLTSNPQLLNSKGPHGFTMLHHALKGGEDSKAVAEYLQSLGAKETKIDFYLKS
jgi:hypothetical protein